MKLLALKWINWFINNHKAEFFKYLSQRKDFISMVEALNLIVAQGTSGYSGISGYTGYSGISGTSGTSGNSGVSGG